MNTKTKKPIAVKKRGRKAGQKKIARTDISLKTIRMDINKPFAFQLRYFRNTLGLSLTEIGERTGFHASNIYHFEMNEGPYKSVTNSLTSTALKYAKALGATKIEIML
jgi:hypothetical protein